MDWGLVWSGGWCGVGADLSEYPSEYARALPV